MKVNVFALYFLLVGTFASLETTSSHSRDDHATLRDNVHASREFLRYLYPSLEKRKYTMSVFATSNYDQPFEARGLTISVGEHYAGYITGVTGGYVGGAPPKDYHPGPNYAVQRVVAHFYFDSDGRMISFDASGPAVGNPQGFDRVFSEVDHHPELAEGEVIALLRKEGAKYGPWNKEEFIKALPLKKLEPFIGSASNISAEFVSRGEDHFVPNDWSTWKVTLTTNWRDKRELKYELQFESFAGDLVSIFGPDQLR